MFFLVVNHDGLGVPICDDGHIRTEVKEIGQEDTGKGHVVMYSVVTVETLVGLFYFRSVVICNKLLLLFIVNK